MYLSSRKLRPIPSSTTDNATMLMDETGNLFPTLRGHVPIDQVVYGPAQGDKSLRPMVDNRNTFVNNLKENDLPPAYMNTAGSDASDSVKYYVLDDAAKNN